MEMKEISAKRFRTTFSAKQIITKHYLSWSNTNVITKHNTGLCEAAEIEVCVQIITKDRWAIDDMIRDYNCGLNPTINLS